MSPTTRAAAKQAGIITVVPTSPPRKPRSRIAIQDTDVQMSMAVEDNTQMIVETSLTALGAHSRRIAKEKLTALRSEGSFSSLSSGSSDDSSASFSTISESETSDAETEPDTNNYDNLEPRRYTTPPPPIQRICRQVFMPDDFAEEAEKQRREARTEEERRIFYAEFYKMTGRRDPEVWVKEQGEKEKNMPVREVATSRVLPKGIRGLGPEGTFILDDSRTYVEEEM